LRKSNEEIQNPEIKKIYLKKNLSGTSIGANYFEAKAASSKNDFINYFNHLLKSANESKLDAKKCNIQNAEVLLKEVSEIANIFASSILTMKGKKDFGF
jgi:four helix bundle protein